MAEISFLETEEKDGYDSELIESFVEQLKDQGIVTSAELLEDQKIKPGGTVENETIDGFDVQFGIVFQDLVFNISPIKSAFAVSQRMAQNRSQVVMALIKTFNPHIPYHVRVDIVEPAMDWDLQLWTVKIRQVFDTLDLDIEKLKNLRYELVVNMRLAATGKLS